MSNIIMNPGSGPVADGGFDQAYENIKQYIEDCEIPMYILEARFTPQENGRYLFVLQTALPINYKVEVEMPALPLDQVRYLGPPQNIWDFPRLYTDGSSWVWAYATVKKEHLISTLKNRNEDFQGEIESNEGMLKQLDSD